VPEPTPDAPRPDDAADAGSAPEDAVDDGAWHLESRAIRAGRQFSGDSLAPVLFPSTTYEVATPDDHARQAGVPRTSHYYSRFGSPSVQELEAAVAELEGAEAALASASGMAAVSNVLLGLCSAGDHVVVQRQLFSVTNSLFTAHLPRFGIEVTFVDGTVPEEFAEAVRTPKGVSKRGTGAAGWTRKPGQGGASIRSRGAFGAGRWQGRRRFGLECCAREVAHVSSCPFLPLSAAGAGAGATRKCSDRA
jgi:nucleotide-binding universal stress UspA family protein